MEQQDQKNPEKLTATAISKVGGLSAVLAVLESTVLPNFEAARDAPEQVMRRRSSRWQSMRKPGGVGSRLMTGSASSQAALMVCTMTKETTWGPGEIMVGSVIECVALYNKANPYR
jgi:hypothetical protein